jgi:hypothetical protein
MKYKRAGKNKFFNKIYIEIDVCEIIGNKL